MKPLLSRPGSGASALGLLFLLTACSGLQAPEPYPQRQARTGDVAFRLCWEGTADLDLHVKDPTGQHVGFLPPTRENRPQILFNHQIVQASGGTMPQGILDVDCNATPEKLCPRPLENIYWPTGLAPEGTYQVWAQLYQPLPDGTEVPFTLEIWEGDRIRESVEGRLAEPMETSEVTVYRFKR